MWQGLFGARGKIPAHTHTHCDVGVSFFWHYRSFSKGRPHTAIFGVPKQKRHPGCKASCELHVPPEPSSDQGRLSVDATQHIGVISWTCAADPFAGHDEVPLTHEPFGHWRSSGKRAWQPAPGELGECEMADLRVAPPGSTSARCDRCFSRRCCNWLQFAGCDGA